MDRDELRQRIKSGVKAAELRDQRVVRAEAERDAERQRAAAAEARVAEAEAILREAVGWAEVDAVNKLVDDDRQADGWREIAGPWWAKAVALVGENGVGDRIAGSLPAAAPPAAPPEPPPGYKLISAGEVERWVAERHASRSAPPPSDPLAERVVEAAERFADGEEEAQKVGEYPEDRHAALEGALDESGLLEAVAALRASRKEAGDG